MANPLAVLAEGCPSHRLEEFRMHCELDCEPFTVRLLPGDLKLNLLCGMRPESVSESFRF